MQRKLNNTSNLNTDIKFVKNVQKYIIGDGAIEELSHLIRGQSNVKRVLYFIDEFFRDNLEILDLLRIRNEDSILYINTSLEPSTDYIDSIVKRFISKDKIPSVIVGMGGGITMDVAKAVSNLLTNDGKAEDYQGWDLVKKQGVFKIAIPTLSGTGAEATRTCVMTNKSTGIKLGMNSDFTVFDQIIMDPSLTKTVSKNQYFHTGMDAYIHCFEALNGSYRNAIGDAYSSQSIKLCREVFNANDMMSDENRSKLMVASYLGGCAIATSYVGVVHPFSAGLSVVLGIHHCIGNCITMRAMKEFYPKEFEEFWNMVEIQSAEIPKGICNNLTSEQYEELYKSTIIHEKPLSNALGSNFKDILTKEKVIEIFKRM